MLKHVAFFDSSQWTAHQPEMWIFRGVTLEMPHDATVALGVPSAEGPDEVCPGPGRGWRLEAECGLQVLVFQELFGATEAVTHLVTPFRSEVDHALRHLPFEATVRSTRSSLELHTGWELSRHDDNGHRFVVGCYPRRASADCMAALLGSGGHKQTYSVRLVEPLPLMVSDVGEWELWRRDEAGNAFLVTRHATRGHAQMQLEALETEPRHKQTYWLSRRATSSPLAGATPG